MRKKCTAASYQFTALFSVFLWILAGCSSYPAASLPSTDLPEPTAPATIPAEGPYWPTDGWRTSLPEDQGMDSQILAEMQDAIQQRRVILHSLLVIRNGYLVSETYYQSYQPDIPHDIYSCTKSFTSTLIGIALDKGYIDRLDHRVVDFFPQRKFANLDPQKEAMTLENLLTMTSGLDWQDKDPTFREMNESPDWVKFVLDKPIIHSPGSQFNYCTGCSHVLSAILQETTGMNTLEFARQTLFEPLGISGNAWPKDRDGVPTGGSSLMITPREMAKLGYLYLRRGQWDGQQIVSEAWVENATQPHIEVDGDMGYGYQWWTYPSLEAYTALGLRGQMIFVIPASDLVIVTTAGMGNDHEDIIPLIEQFIVPSIQPSSN
jgi:CubicO group peptidase (beta-lactamase class C family)